MKKTLKNITGLALTAVMAIGCIIACDSFVSAQPVDSYKQNAVKNIDTEMYIIRTRRKIKDNWYPPVRSFENTATMVIKLDRKGQLLNCTLSAPSQDEGFNESLINAAKKVVYSPLPDDYPYDTIEMDFQFSMQRRLKPHDNVTSQDVH